MIHVAITRRIRRGAEQEFESLIHEFFRQTQREGGTSEGYLVRPLEGSEFGILRSFSDESEMDQFYSSDLYRRWNERIEPLVDGPPVRRQIHGLEAFFRPEHGNPKTWKMAVVTWLAVNPAVFIFSHALPPWLGSVPPLVQLFVVNAFVVAALTWILMPLLTRLLHGWLLNGPVRTQRQ